MTTRSEQCKSNTCATPDRETSRNLFMENLLALSSAELMDIFFGDSLNNFRKSVETMTAQNQCKSVIGECCELAVEPGFKFFDANLHNKEVNSYCWICGHGLKQLVNNPTVEYNLRSRHIPETVFKPVHCEHIVPVLFACLFGGLHSRLDKENVFTDVFTKATASNYKYAHGSCNLKKSNLLLFTWNDEEQRMVFNETNGLALFEKLKIKQATESYKTAFLQNLRTHINPICDLINAEYNGFKKDHKDMTSYIKYTINCTGYYFSAKHRASFLSAEEQRDKMSFYLGKIKTIVEHNRENAGEVQISTGLLNDIIKDNEMYITTVNDILQIEGTENRERYIRDLESNPDFIKTPNVSVAPKRLLEDAIMPDLKKPVGKQLSEYKKPAVGEVVEYRPMTNSDFNTPVKKANKGGFTSRVQDRFESRVRARFNSRRNGGFTSRVHARLPRHSTRSSKRRKNVTLRNRIRRGTRVRK